MAAGTLPDDLIIDIFSRLSVKSVSRFRCVHRSWNSLFKSSSFITNHLKISYSKDFLVMYNEYIKESTCQFRVLTTDTFDERLYLRRSFESGFRVVGCCNGLVCLMETEPFYGFTGKIIIYNPSIRGYKIIPDPECNIWEIEEGSVISVRQVGLGYDSLNNDYKVVVVVSWYHPVKKHICRGQCNVYTLGANCWRKVALPESNIYMDLCFAGTNPFFNGAIHWMGGWNRKTCYRVTSFDISSEVFQMFSLPDCFILDGPGTRAQAISIYRGLLCVLKWWGWDVNTFSCELWVMKEYGVEESWSKLYAFQLFYPLWFSGFGLHGEFFLHNREDRQLTMYDPDIEEYKILFFHEKDVHTIRVLSYTHSIVSP